MAAVFAACAGEVLPSDSTGRQETRAPLASTPVSADAAALKEMRESLKEQRELLQKQADTNYVHFEKTVERVIWGFGVVGAVIFALIIFFIGSTRRELRNTVRELFQEHGKQQIDEQAAAMRGNIEELQSELARITAYRDQNIVWVFDPDITTVPEGQESTKRWILAARVVEALRSMGLQRIQLLTPQAREPVDIGTPDLVILSYSPGPGSPEFLKALVEKLKTFSPPVFLIIDTYNPTGQQIRLLEPELAALAGFDWYVPVNFPSQLIAQTHLLVRRNRALLEGARANG
jgi:hypothetical protein